MSDRAADSATVLRRCFAGLAAVSVAVTAVELVLIRHWTSTEQLIPWAAVAVGLAVLFARPGPRSLRAVRVLGVAVILTSAFGIFEHVHANDEPPRSTSATPSGGPRCRPG